MGEQVGTPCGASSARAAPRTQPLFCWGHGPPCSHTGQGLGAGQCQVWDPSPTPSRLQSSGLLGFRGYFKDVTRLGFSPATSQLGTLGRPFGASGLCISLWA